MLVQEPVERRRLGDRERARLGDREKGRLGDWEKRSAEIRFAAPPLLRLWSGDESSPWSRASRLEGLLRLGR
jgi:hypothetical protein